MNAATAALAAARSRIKSKSCLLGSNRINYACTANCVAHACVVLLTIVLQIVKPKSNRINYNVPQSNHTTPLTPRHMRARTHLTHILEGVRACGKAVPGRHSRLCQSNTSAHPEVTCKGTTTNNHVCVFGHVDALYPLMKIVMLMPPAVFL